MNRRDLFKRAAALALAPAAAKLPAQPALSSGVIRSSVLTTTDDFQIFGEPLTAFPLLATQRGALRYATPSLLANGGICEPVEPYYPVVEMQVRDWPARVASLDELELL